MQSVRQNLRIQKIITGIALVLFIIKVFAWYLTGSVAILTDALESIVNVMAGFIGVYSLYISAKPRDMDHPYGHGKAEFISAAIEGTLITVAGMIIIYEALNNLIHPHTVKQLDYGILLVAVTAVINFITGAFCVRKGEKSHSLVLIAGGKHLKTDTYSTAGIIIGLLLLLYLKLWWIDSAVAILFAFIILFTGYKIIRTSIGGIMDETDISLMNKVVGMLNMHRREHWIDLHNLRIIRYGGTLHLDCHLTVPWYLNVHEAHQEIDALSGLVREEFGESMELFVHTDGCLDFSCSICTNQHCKVRQHPFEKKIIWTVENIITNRKHYLEKNKVV